jgi:hypothetical protein
MHANDGSARALDVTERISINERKERAPSHMPAKQQAKKPKI